MTQILDDKLAQRIIQTLKKGADQVLLCDDSVEWTGYEIQLRMKQIQEIIEALTPPGARVAVALPSLAVQALAIFSVISCSRVPVIVNQSDLDQGPAMNSRMKMEQVQLLLSMTGNADLLAPTLPQMTLNQNGRIESTRTFSGSRSARDIATPRLESPTDEKTAVVLFTSGSTGEPKGIHIPEAGLLRTIDYLTSYFGINSSTVSPISLPISHSMALNTQLFPTFLASGKSYMMNSWASVGRVYRSIKEQKGTFVSLIGEMLRVCWDEKQRRGLDPAEHVEHVQLAGGMITSRHVELARELFPNARLHKGYGLTEAIRVSMIDSRDPDFTTSSVGTPLPFLNVEVRDGLGQPVGPSRVGEIFVKGPSVMLGASGLKHNPIGTDSFLATGDLGFWNKRGHLCISGRADGMLKINGQRVASSEIERLALETSDLIRDAKCIAVENHGRDGKKLVLLLEVPPDDQDGFFAAGSSRGTGDIAKKMQNLRHVPKEIIILGRFPRNATGKLALSKLKNLYNTHLQRQRLAALKIPQSRLQFFKLPTGEGDDLASV